MPLWSLTQERVEKLLKQIGDREVEIDELIKLSKEDLWKKDLDDFIAEWRFQLEDDHQRARKVASLGRRVSSKLKTGGRLGAGTVKKRKADEDDSDFSAPVKKKTVIKKIKPTPGLLNHMSPQRRASITSLTGSKSSKPISVDGGDDSMGEDIAPIFKKTKAAAVKAKGLKDDDDASVASEPAAKPRRARAATKKAIKYLSSSESDDDGDKLLGDISNMVKGTSGSGDSATDSRTLFSTSLSRPGSSAGLKTSRPSKITIADLSADETDYSKLVPQPSPRRSILVTAKDTKLSEDGDDDSDVLITTKPAAKVTAAKQTKTATKTTAARGRGKKAAAAPRTASKSEPGPAKKTQMSPTAKAYAARQAKASKVIIDSDDDIDAMANDILDSPANDDAEDAPKLRDPPAGRSRRTVAVKKPSYTIDDESLLSQSEEPSSDVFSGSE
jgi:DNA topoisomerase-2